MKKILSLIICTAMLLSVFAIQTFALGIGLPFDVNGNSVCTLSDTELGTSEAAERVGFNVDGEYVLSLSSAFAKVADTGSVIELTGDDESVYIARENIDVNTDVTMIAGRNAHGTMRTIEYSGNYLPLFTVKNEGKLTLKYCEIRLVDTDVAGNGKLIVVEQGGTLVLDGTAEEPVTFSDSSDSSGMILVRSGGTLVYCGATFNGNESDNNIKVDEGGAVIFDLNGDRVINVADLYLMRKYLESPETTMVAFYPDFNLDGNVNATDVALLLDYLTKSGSDAVDISDTKTYRVSASPDKSVSLRFTPKENANRTFVLPTDAETDLWYILYDQNGNLIDCDYFGSDSGKISDNGTFEITCDFVAGTEYCFEIGTAAEVEFDLDNPLAQSENTPVSGFTLSEGSLTVIVGIAAAVVFGFGGFFIGRAKKKPTASNE